MSVRSKSTYVVNNTANLWFLCTGYWRWFTAEKCLYFLCLKTGNMSWTGYQLLGCRCKVTDYTGLWCNANWGGKNIFFSEVHRGTVYPYVIVYYNLLSWVTQKEYYCYFPFEQKHHNINCLFFKVIIVTKKYGSAMSQVIGCQPFNLEAQVCSQASTREICGGQGGSGTGSSTTTSVSPVFLPVHQFPLSVSFHQCSILIHSYTATHAV
jgi:hypothetical protein